MHEEPTSGRQSPVEHEDLTRVFLGGQSLVEVLDRVVRRATFAIPGIDEASITVADENRPLTVVFTDELAVHLDERQYAAGFGPCIDAARTGRLIQLPDTSADPSYPDFAAQALRAGVTRTMSVGLPAPDRHVGGLNLYARSGVGFDDRTLEVARSFAADAAVAVANATLYARTKAEVDQMREAMATRAVIEQAKGMIMVVRDCDGDQAFRELKRRASSSGQKVRAVADAVVAQRGRGL